MVLQPIHELSAVVVDELGRRHQASVVGVPRGDGLWDGYVEFRDDEGGVHVTPRETTQPNARDLFYWATGLSATYLEGALVRATDDAVPFEKWRRPHSVM